MQSQHKSNSGLIPSLQPEHQIRAARRRISVAVLNSKAAFRKIAGVAVLAATLVAGGAERAGAVTPGKVAVWGYGGFGATDVPAGLSGVTAIAASTFHSMALKSDGTVVAWGYNGYGETNVPSGLSGVTAIAAGATHSLALKSDGTVVGWGANSFGQATAPSTLSGVTAISAGGTYSLALKSDGTVVAWGDNRLGQATVPSELSTGGVIAISAGEAHGMALKSDGTVVAWGYNFYGQTDVPPGLTGVQAISAGFHHSLALKNGGTVVAWGGTNSGEASVPPGLSGVTAISAGYEFSLALKEGTIIGWGHNGAGQLSAPAGLSAIEAISAGGYHTMIIAPDVTPPVITRDVTGTLNNGWHIANVALSWNVSDPDTPITSQSGCESTTVNSDTAGTTFTCAATSSGGTASQSVTIKRDTSSPNISCSAADGAWHSGDVNIGCTAGDTTSGLANPANATFNLTTSVANGIETTNALTDSRSIGDAAGNSVNAGPIGGNKIDKKAPAITITTPTATSYLVNEAVPASYSCSDGGSGVVSCAGPVASGVNINTATGGSKTFTVNAADKAGNSGNASVSYTVNYNFSGFLAPVNPAPTVNTGKAGRTYPVKWQLRGSNGSYISALSAIASVTYQSTPCGSFANAPSDPLEASTSGNSSLRYDTTTNQYTYNWASPAAGCYSLFVTLDSGQAFPAYFNLSN